MAATWAGSARAQIGSPPDPTLLTTTLTPLGAERAGNADGSIPAWTGGNVTAPALANQPIDVPIFADEHALYSVDASNMAQYANLLTPGTQKLMTESGLKINVFPTHRTAAAPQYVYDNTAKNVTRAQFDPSGMRFGVVGAYAGPPFPIINTSDPNIGGSQLVWNHLHRWQTFVNFTKLSGGYVVINDKVILSFGGSSHFICPYYDPAGCVVIIGQAVRDGTWCVIRLIRCLPHTALAVQQCPGDVGIPINIATHPHEVFLAVRRRWQQEIFMQFRQIATIGLRCPGWVIIWADEVRATAKA